MGRVGCEPVIQHLSHPQHPLELSNLQQQQALAPATCAGCRQRASGWAYSCNACRGYHLHITCAQMPQLINHPADPHHPLALLPVPAYPDGAFTCDACGRPGTGFSYHCATCGLDFHTLCASMPLSVTHHAHAHPLALAFSPPYATNVFSCDVCGGVGARYWRYRCAACDFDAHLGCATARTTRPTQQPQLGGAPAVGTQRGFQPVVGGVPTRAWQGSGLGVAPPTVGRSGSSNRPGNNSLVGQAFQGVVDGAAQQMGQILVQSILGGGGGAGGGGNGGAVQGGSSNPLLRVGSSVIGAVLGGGGGSST